MTIKTGIIEIPLPSNCSHCRFYRSITLDVSDCLLKPRRGLKMHMVSKGRQAWCPIKEVTGVREDETN